MLLSPSVGRAYLACSAIKTWPLMTQCTSEHHSHCSSRRKLTVERDSTPPTFTIYLCSLVLRSLLASPPLPLASGARPLSPLSEFADKKSSLVYALLDDASGFYVGTADKAARSRMNVTFRLKGGEALEKKFIAEASEKGIKGVAGHRSVGGESF